MQLVKTLVETNFDLVFVLHDVAVELAVGLSVDRHPNGPVRAVAPIKDAGAGKTFAPGRKEFAQRQFVSGDCAGKFQMKGRQVLVRVDWIVDCADADVSRQRLRLPFNNDAELRVPVKAVSGNDLGFSRRWPPGHIPDSKSDRADGDHDQPTPEDYSTERTKLCPSRLALGFKLMTKEPTLTPGQRLTGLIKIIVRVQPGSLR